MTAFAGVIVATAAGRRRAGPARTTTFLWAVAAAGLTFQLVHFAEHVLQAGYWALHPAAPAWITPWAAAGPDLLAAAADHRPATGAELLHLLGNGIFLAGLAAALWYVDRSSREPRPGPWSSGSGAARQPLLVATWLQGVHVAEHVSLTVSWLLAGQALGVSTLFGAFALDDPRAVALRVWFHFALNLAATAYAVRGAVAGRLWQPPGRTWTGHAPASILGAGRLHSEPAPPAGGRL